MLLSFPENGDSLPLIVESAVYQNMNPAPYQRVGSKKHWNLSTKRRPQSGCLVPAFWQVKYSESVPYVFEMSDFFFGGGAPQSTSLSYSIIVSLTQGNHVSQLPSWRWALDVANAAPLCPALLVFWPMGRCLHPVETGSLNSDLHSLNLDTPIISSLILSIYKNLWFHRAYFLTHHWVHEGSMGHFIGVNGESTWWFNQHGWYSSAWGWASNCLTLKVTHF